MKLLGLMLLMTLSVVSAELLHVLRLLHASDAYHFLDPEEQVMLTELIAAAEACKLTALANSVGKETIIALVVHLPGQLESAVTNYLATHIGKEQQGTCVVDGAATARPTHRPHNDD